MRSILPKIKNSFRSEKGICLCLLSAVFLVLAIANFPFGKWFLGWDNLVPELNYSLNLRNNFFSAWQENEGLGLTGGHGFAATLPYTISSWLLSLVLPTQYLRPVFTLLMAYLGALGCFFLCTKVIKTTGKERNSWFSLLASLFYLLNFATIQMFYIPLEAFSIHFAALPWLFWSLTCLIQTWNKKNLIIFVLISFLSSSQGFIPQLFLVYLAFLVIFCLAILLTKRSFSALKKVGLILLVTLAVNSYWLLPLAYYSLTTSGVYLNAYNNLMSTGDFIDKSEKFGTFSNLILFKGFISEAIDATVTSKSFIIFQLWNEHLKNNLVVGGYILFFLFTCFGFVASILERSFSIKKIFAIFLVLSFGFLASSIFPFSLAFNFLGNIFPVFKQAFRISFTKFSISYSLFYSVFLGIGIYKIFSFLRKFNSKVRLFLGIAGFIGLFATIVYISWPAFKGNFFYNRIRLNLPEEYSQTFDFFNAQDPNTRIANFPLPRATGWTIYRWGYSGSGFWWYSLPQPILDRNFDVWSNYNENYYWEISYALYSKNKPLFEKVLEKYQVNWLLVDGNVIDPSSAKALFLDELEEMLGEDFSPAEPGRNDKYKLVQTFGKIKIYKVNLETKTDNFVWVEKDLPIVNGYEWGNQDQAYGDTGEYQVLRSKPARPGYQGTENFDVYYPFRSLFTGRKTDELEVEIEDLGDRFVFRKQLPKGLTGYKLIVPPYDGNELVEIDKTDLTKVQYFIPTANIVGDTVEVVVPKIKGLFGAEIDPAKVEEVLEAQNCNRLSNGKVISEKVISGKDGATEVLKLTTVDANNCSAVFWLPDLPNKYGYLISTETKNISGKSLLFWIENLTNRKADMELYLGTKSYLIQPPMAEDGLGYSLHFDNISIGKKQTVNELGKISVNPIPYNFLTGIKLVESSKQQGVSGASAGLVMEVKHPNPAVYEVKIEGTVEENTTLILSQSYHDGWKAYEINSKFKMQNEKLWKTFPFLFGKEIKEHVVVNNWENGWTLESDKQYVISDKNTIVLVFWPQYLEYLGFLFLIFCFLFVLFAVKW